MKTVKAKLARTPEANCKMLRPDETATSKQVYPSEREPKHVTDSSSSQRSSTRHTDERRVWQGCRNSRPSHRHDALIWDNIAQRL